MERSNEAPGQIQGSPQASSTTHVSKRPRYTPIACDECKRRKIKCDGQAPCHRCERSSTTCVYAQRGSHAVSQQDMYVGPPLGMPTLTTSSEWKQMNEKLAKLQDQIDLLVSTLATGGPPGQRQQQPQLAPITPASASLPEQTNISLSPHSRDRHDGTQGHRSTRGTSHPQYLGPTSSTYSLGLARTSLQEMGIQPRVELGENGILSHSPTPARSPLPSNDQLYNRNPLLSITRNEAIRLVEVYEDESGTVYPFVDVKLLLRTVERVYDGTNPAHQAQATRASAQEKNMLSGGVVDILKLVIAIASVFEGHGPTRLSRKLLDNIESGFEGRLCGPKVDMFELQAWTLMSILQFHCDEEAVAWRTIGLAARAAIELGLHRRETYFSRFSDPQQRQWATKLFWCIYVLDKRWSFGTGLPFALHDDDLDSDLPELSDSDSPLLKIMVSYGRLGSRVWKATSNLTVPVDAETQAFLNFKVLQWKESIGPDLRLCPNARNMLDGHNRATNRLRVLLYLRANQMRLLVYRRALMSSKDIIKDPKGAQEAVDIAKDTIYVLDNLNKTSDIYSSQQTSFNYFLVSALATIILAVCHATSQFNQSCRKEFYVGLDLVRGFSSHSYVARRLWRTVRHMKVIGPRLGILPTAEPSRGAMNGSSERAVLHRHSTAPDPSPGGEYGLVQGFVPNIGFDAEISPAYSFLLDGNQLGNDLTSLFEAIEPPLDPLSLSDPEFRGNLDVQNYGTTDALTRSLMDLF